MKGMAGAHVTAHTPKAVEGGTGLRVLTKTSVLAVAALVHSFAVAAEYRLST